MSQKEAYLQQMSQIDKKGRRIGTMSQENNLFKALPQATLRQWRSTPTYFFLIWRWGNWVFALVWLLSIPVQYAEPHVLDVLHLCLFCSFFYTLAVTLYNPVASILISRFSRQRNQKHPSSQKLLRQRFARPYRSNPQFPGRKEETTIFRPLMDLGNKYLNISIYCLDVVICGLLTYFSGVNSNPQFGDGSPFYRYGLSSVLVAGFTYSYGGGLLAALGYSVFACLGAFLYPPGQVASYNLIHLGNDLAGSIVDAPLIALLAAFVAGQLNTAIQSKRHEQDNVRRERALRGVSETLVAGITNQVLLLRNSVKAIRQGGHFEKLVIALVRQGQGNEPVPDFDTYAETDVSDAEHPDVSEELVTVVAKTGRRHLSFDPLSTAPDGSSYGIARLYQPFFKEKQIYLVIGAESTRYTPFEQRQEEFLAIVGPQLVIALENIRLTEEAAALATLAERNRIAREMHDGVAQLLYMLSLSSETCQTQVERVATLAADQEIAPALTSVSQHLEKLVTISKQALWETRHYMFMLRPMLGGNSSLTQLLTSQLHEFEAISGLQTRMEVEGEEQLFTKERLYQQRLAQASMAIFRITQEGLTNAYKHAHASQITVRLCYQLEQMIVEVCDNGLGMAATTPGSEHIYTGRGLQGMRERAAELGGSLDIAPYPGGGTRVTASIPMQVAGEKRSSYDHG
jgi:signal transduction histidine kinase